MSHEDLTKFTPGNEVAEAILQSRLDSAIRTLQDIAALKKGPGKELAIHRLRQLGVDVPDYGSMT